MSDSGAGPGEEPTGDPSSVDVGRGRIDSDATRGVRLARGLLGRRRRLLVLLASWTLFFSFPILNLGLDAFDRALPGPVLEFASEIRKGWPNDPIIGVQDEFAELFGDVSIVWIVVLLEKGDAEQSVFRPETLRKIARITNRVAGDGFDPQAEARRALRERLVAQGWEEDELEARLDDRFPPYPVRAGRVRSITTTGARTWLRDARGEVTTRPLVESIPETRSDARAIENAFRATPSLTRGRLVSRDGRAALIRAEFETDGLESGATRIAVFDHLRRIQREESDAQHRVLLAGDPVVEGLLAKRTFEIGLFIVLSGTIIIVLLWLYFRRARAVAIPGICLVASAIWGVGLAGWAGVALDPMMLLIPILLGIRGLTHSIQIANRFFEEYEALRPAIGSGNRARLDATARAFGASIRPASVAIAVDSAGWSVLALSSIPILRETALVGVVWTLSLGPTVVLLHPLLLATLRSPDDHEHFLPGFMMSIANTLADVSTHPSLRPLIVGLSIVTAIGCLVGLGPELRLGESSAGPGILDSDHGGHRARQEIARRFGGTERFVAYFQGGRRGAAREAAALQEADRFAHYMERETQAHATLSSIATIRDAARERHDGDPKWGFIPGDAAALHRALDSLARGGEHPGLAMWLSDDGRHAAVELFYPDARRSTVSRALESARSFPATPASSGFVIRLDEEQGAPEDGIAAYIQQGLKKAFAPLIPQARGRLSIEFKGKDGIERRLRISSRANGDRPPAWLDTFRRQAIAASAGSSRTEADRAPDPADLARAPIPRWRTRDALEWWTSPDATIRAVSVRGRHLVIQDLEAEDSRPLVFASRFWSRGAGLVLAGGDVVVEAATLAELERVLWVNGLLFLLVLLAVHGALDRSFYRTAMLLVPIGFTISVVIAGMTVMGIGLELATVPMLFGVGGLAMTLGIYMIDRIGRELRRVGVGQEIKQTPLDQAIRRAVRSTGREIVLVILTTVAGLAFWGLSDLRFQTDAAGMLCLGLLASGLGATFVLPAFASIARPNFGRRRSRLVRRVVLLRRRARARR